MADNPELGITVSAGEPVPGARPRRFFRIGPDRFTMAVAKQIRIGGG